MASNEAGTQREEPAPSQINGQLKAAQGTLYTAVGSVLPESAGVSWTQSGQALVEQGQKELDEAKAAQASEATWDAGVAKLKSSFDHHHAERLIRDPSEYLGGLLTPPRATGYLTGNQQKQTEGNLENEKAQWEYKQATSEGIAAVPIPSVEGVKGKVESVVGMVTGDQERQREGNVKAEKAAWTEGV
ncbi:hypothetical protein EHS25_006166 [Saitozyma podzolica]|uniref:CsbD-like domain-containing protein n=1 Tax=Saitozyma podzolica TaxID=1890683 RepID=A0A427XRT2_9TREE|nr:hypothetical protein EHS25_006166 [Saitozyma podzolica]